MNPGGGQSASFSAKAAAFARRALARTAVSLALFAAGAAMSLFWSSFLVQRASHSLDGAISHQAGTAVTGGVIPGATSGDGQSLALDTGPQASAVSHDLRAGSAGALVATALLFPAGLVLTPSRHRRQVLARLGRWGLITGGLLTGGTWLVPALVEALSSGGAHHVAASIVSTDSPGRLAAVSVTITGGALLAVTHLQAKQHRGLVFPVGEPAEVPAR